MNSQRPLQQVSASHLMSLHVPPFLPIMQPSPLLMMRVCLKKSAVSYPFSYISSSSLVLEFGFDPATYSFSESDGSASGLTVVSTGASTGEFSIRIFAGTDDVNTLATALGMKYCQ